MIVDRLAVICSALGAVLVVLSITLRYFVIPALPAESVWTNEEATALAEASMDYHAKSFDQGVNEAERAESAAHYREQAAQLERAKSGRDNLPTYLQYAGGLFVLLGAACYVIAKIRADEEQ